MQEMQVRSLGWEDPLGKKMAIHSSILAWEIPWSEESGGLQSMEMQKSMSTHTIMSKIKSVSFIKNNFIYLFWLHCVFAALSFL